MKRMLWMLLPLMLLVSCKGEKKMVQYESIYREQPTTIYIAPVDDRSERVAMRSYDDSAYNASLGVAAKQLYLTASAPLVRKGYYVLGPIASAQLAATEQRTLKQLRNDPITDLQTELGIDAVLFITIQKWTHKQNSWSATIDYTLRSTRTGTEVMHTVVQASKTVNTNFKGLPVALPEDDAFMRAYHCDFQTAQRCRLVEVLNQYVLGDMPFGSRWRADNIERHVSTHPEYFDFRINTDGSVMVVPSDSVE